MDSRGVDSDERRWQELKRSSHRRGNSVAFQHLTGSANDCSTKTRNIRALKMIVVSLQSARTRTTITRNDNPVSNSDNSSTVQ